MKKVFTNKIVLFLIAMVLVGAAVAPSVYFYRQYTALKKEVAAAATPKQEDPKAIVARVAKHILLPTGEDPTIMTVTDKQKLSGQLFFVNAKNGDKVLVYEKAKKAFLYDPVADLVIEVGPIMITASESGTLSTAVPTPGTSSATLAPTPQKAYTFALLNATQVSGLTKTYEAKLLSAIATAQVVARGNAKGDYPTSLLVDVTGTRTVEASALAGKLGLTVAAMPVGESTPSADFLIILGADQK
jgi:hypothetical protein